MSDHSPSRTSLFCGWRSVFPAGRHCLKDPMGHTCDARPLCIRCHRSHGTVSWDSDQSETLSNVGWRRRAKFPILTIVGIMEVAEVCGVSSPES